MPRPKLPPGPGRPKGLPNKTTREVKDFARKFLSSSDYVSSAKARVLSGDAAHLEVLWHHYAYGKPKESVQISGDIPPFILKLDGE